MKVRFKSKVTRGFSFSPLRDSCSPLRGSLIGKKQKNLWDQGTTSYQSQGKFLQILNEFMTSNLNISQLIIGGDWNTTLECIDKKGGTRWKPTAYRNGIISMMEELDLIDIFRKLKPIQKAFHMNPNF